LSHFTPALATTIGLKVRGERLGRDAVLSIPTPDHYLPLLYVLATAQQRDVITFPIEGNVAASPAKKRRRLTPEGRKRLSDMMKKRWAERRKSISRGAK